MSNRSRSRRMFELWLKSLPENVGGRNLSLLTGVNHAVRGGLDPDEIVTRIVVASGEPPLTVEEVRRAVEKVVNGSGVKEAAVHTRKVAPPAYHGIVRRLVDEGRGATFGTLTSLSPIRLPAGDSDEDRLTRGILAVRTLFDENDRPCIGDVTDVRTEARSFWEDAMKATPPDEWDCFVAANPFSGSRCLANVSSFRHAILEFDFLSLDEQLAFWTTIIRRGLLPVSTVTYSGSKSLHGLVRLGAASMSAFTGLWDRMAAKFASPADPRVDRCDTACRDASHLTRLPEARNPKTGKVQRLLYLADLNTGMEDRVASMTGIQSDATQTQENSR